MIDSSSSSRGSARTPPFQHSPKKAGIMERRTPLFPIIPRRRTTSVAIASGDGDFSKRTICLCLNEIFIAVSSNIFSATEIFRRKNIMVRYGLMLQNSLITALLIVSIFILSILYGRAEIRHAFIYRTFLIPNSTSFDTRGYDTLVALLVAESADQFPFAQCIFSEPTGRSGTNRRRSHISTWTVPAVVSRVDYVGICQYVINVVWCTFPPRRTHSPADEFTENGEHSEDSPAFGKGAYALDLGLSPKGLNIFTFPSKNGNKLKRFQQQISSPAKVRLSPVTVADRRARQLVMCVSRVFAFEQWPVLITAMEVYRSLGVDLVVTHIYSVLTPIYRLLRAYEADGRLALREGIRFPRTRDMGRDPDWELEYSGQLAMAHDCVYEFRESAKFIVLVDWDDVVVSLGKRSLGEALEAAASRFPEAPYFFINKFESAMERHWGRPTVRSLQSMVRNVRTKPQYNSEKLAIRPSRLFGFWIHFSRDYNRERWRTSPPKLPNEDLLILHLNRELNVSAMAPQGYTLRLMERLIERHPSLLGGIQNKNKLVGGSSRDRELLLRDLPRGPPIYIDAIRNCSTYINAYPDLHWPPPCLSYSRCRFELIFRQNQAARGSRSEDYDYDSDGQTMIPCVVSQSHFRSTTIDFVTGGRRVVHTLVQSRFREKLNGCF